MGWLVNIRRWLKVEPDLHDVPHPAVTSPEERRRIELQIEETRQALNALLALASLDWERDERRRHAD